MLRLWVVKHVVIKIAIYLSFVQKLLWYFIVNWIEFGKSENLLLHRQQLLLFSKFSKNEILRRVDRCRLGKDFIFQQLQHFCFSQSDSNMSFGKIKVWIMVKLSKGPDHEICLLMNTVVHVVVPMLLTSTPQWQSKHQIFVLFMEVFFDWQMSPK